MERGARRLFDSAPMSVPRNGADVPAVYALRQCSRSLLVEWPHVLSVAVNSPSRGRRNETQ